MKEYRVYRQNNGGTPFCLRTLQTLSEAKRYIYNCIANYEELHYFYYVDNDFFDNKYSIGLKGLFYFQIQERDVSAWSITNEKKDLKNNIIYFK